MRSQDSTLKRLFVMSRKNSWPMPFPSLRQRNVGFVADARIVIFRPEVANVLSLWNHIYSALINSKQSSNWSLVS